MFTQKQIISILKDFGFFKVKQVSRAVVHVSVFHGPDMLSLTESGLFVSVPSENPLFL